MTMTVTRPAPPTRSRPGWPRLALLVRADQSLYQSRHAPPKPQPAPAFDAESTIN